MSNLRTPKHRAEDALQDIQKQIWAAELEAAVTYPIDHEAIARLTAHLSVAELRAIPYLPDREDLIERAEARLEEQ